MEPIQRLELLWSVLGEAGLPVDTGVGISDDMGLFFLKQPLPWMKLGRTLLGTITPRN